jgi:hypothetical protein
MTQNLVEPIVMNTATVLIFCRDHVCINCLNKGRLQAIYQDVDKFIVRCSNCKQDIREGDAISKHQMDNMKVNEKIGKWELKDPPKEKQSIEQAIKDLGFD